MGWATGWLRRSLARDSVLAADGKGAPGYEGRPRRDAQQPTLLGHSIGRWEGDVLVVDTVGFAAHPEGMGFELPSSTEKRIVERFALGRGRKHLDYEITVEDAEYLSAPVTHRAQWAYRPGQRPRSIPCDPAVARRFLGE